MLGHSAKCGELSRRMPETRRSDLAIVKLLEHAMPGIMSNEPHICNKRRDEMLSEAIFLMKKSLGLLDQAGAGCTVFGCHLSMAIDTAEATPLPQFETAVMQIASDLYH